MTTTTSIDELCINTIRVLSADAVQKANSGHPGMPMGAAAMAYALWDRHLHHSPANPQFPNRDRFILSAGHGSMLLYSLLYLTGYGVSLDDLKQFRQWGSRTPGHPEHGLTPGVEVTTGPLGQGFANGVGMAMAAKHLAAVYNRPGHDIVDHYIYAIVSDGDLMEGLSHEAASLAGHLKLGNLIYLYDDNLITLDGNAELSLSDDVVRRFEGYGWHVERVDGMDPDVVDIAIRNAQAVKDRPSLIAARTHIGFGAPHVQDTSAAHGKALGNDELRLVKQRFGFNPDESFVVPGGVTEHMRQAVDRGGRLEADWQQTFAAYEKAFPELAAQWTRVHSGALPEGWDAAVPVFAGKDPAMATRSAQARFLNAVAECVPELFGGSADLSSSTDTTVKAGGTFAADSYGGRNVYFGVREHAMAAAVNGMVLYGGVKAFGGTFLNFYDYMRPAVRLAAVMEIPSIFVFTHDSIGLGEDGPTHQPVEQLSGFRGVPNLTLLRPADANETAAAWTFALQNRRGPVALVLCRQPLPILDQQQYGSAAGVHQGAYILADAEGGDPEVILIATGSEVQFALGAREQLAVEGIRARVVSMPGWQLFERQPQSYRASVLPPSVRARVSIEAASPLGWRQWVGDDGIVIGLDHFGASAPAERIYQEFGFTAEHVAAAARSLVRPGSRTS